MTPNATSAALPAENRWAEYIRRAAAGDEAAFGCLYDESKGLVYGIAMRVLSDRADAEEVTLDVYTQVWRCARDYDGHRGSVTSWLVLLARSRAIDRIRSRSARTRVERPIDRDFGGDEATEEIVWLKQERARIRKALDKLGADQRALVELAFFGGFTHSELAARLNLPLGTVKTRIRLAMAKLKQELAAPALKTRFSDGAA